MYSDKGGNDADRDGHEADGRIGRQLRLLSREIDEDNIVKICQQIQVMEHFAFRKRQNSIGNLFCANLQESLVVHDNMRYIRYNLITIGNSLIETFKLATSWQTRAVVALTLARLGYVSDLDFNR